MGVGVAPSSCPLSYRRPHPQHIPTRDKTPGILESAPLSVPDFVNQPEYRIFLKSEGHYLSGRRRTTGQCLSAQLWVRALLTPSKYSGMDPSKPTESGRDLGSMAAGALVRQN